MSFLGKFFAGGKKVETEVDTKSAISKLRETEDVLLKKQEFLEKKVEEELAVIKTNASKNRRVALEALKRKKRYEKNLQQLDGTLATLEMQRETLESSVTNTSVLETMKLAADAMKKAHKHMDIDQVHNMMDDIGEQQDIAREISEAISNPIAFGLGVDDDDLAAELEKLEEECLNEELLRTDDVPAELPNAYNEPLRPVIENVPRKLRKEHEEDTKELEFWAS